MDKKTYERLCDKFNKIHKEKGDLTIADALFGVGEVLGTDTPLADSHTACAEPLIRKHCRCCQATYKQTCTCRPKKESSCGEPEEDCHCGMKWCPTQKEEKEWRKKLLEMISSMDHYGIQKESIEYLRKKYV